MSFAPRPHTRPSRISPPPGRASTSRGRPWARRRYGRRAQGASRPAPRPPRPMTTVGAPAGAPRRPRRVVRMSAGSGWNTSTTSPADSRRPTASAAMSSSRPVTLGIRTSLREVARECPRGPPRRRRHALQPRVPSRSSPHGLACDPDLLPAVGGRATGVVAGLGQRLEALRARGGGGARSGTSNARSGPLPRRARPRPRRRSR